MGHKKSQYLHFQKMHLDTSVCAPNYILTPSNFIRSVSVVIGGHKSHHLHQYNPCFQSHHLHQYNPCFQSHHLHQYNPCFQSHHLHQYNPCFRSPGNSPHKGQWRGALIFSLICTWINGWVNNREAGDLRRHRAHHDVTVMINIINHSLWFRFRNILRSSIIWPSTGLPRLVDPQHDSAS